MIFTKNQELVLLPLKCKLTLVLAKSAGACVKSKIYLRRVPQWNESWYVYPRWSIIYVRCCAQLSISRFGSRFTRKPDSNTLKMEKDFSWDKTKISLRGISSHPKGHARVRYGLAPINYAMIRAEPSPFDLKVMQPRMRDFLVNCLSQCLIFFSDI
jgi:hypothetical protein